MAPNPGKRYQTISPEKLSRIALLLRTTEMTYEAIALRVGVSKEIVRQINKKQEIRKGARGKSFESI